MLTRQVMNPTSTPFTLSAATIKILRELANPFENNGLGEQVYKRTYSRGDEKWVDTIIRVIEGTYRMQQRHIENNGLGWDSDKAQESAREMGIGMHNMKWLPPGRGLWCMGTKVTEEKGIFTALNNCAFVSTADIASTKSLCFRFAMDVLMLGVGCGFDVRGAGKVTILTQKSESGEEGKAAMTQYQALLAQSLETIETKIAATADGWMKNNLIDERNLTMGEIDKVKKMGNTHTFVIEDTREGWVEATGVLIDSYLVDSLPVIMDYSKIRPAGIPLATFGGTSSGPEPLVDLHIYLRSILDKNAGSPITITTITDIMNLIGKCVVSGNVRRSSEIALGPADSEEFINLKNYTLNPNRAAYGWGSNNSVIASVGDDYSGLVDQIKTTGEPGIFWLDNTRAFSRMVDPADWKDKRVVGTNPCAEQSLEDMELCCLCEVFIARHETKEEFLRTLKFAYLYAKTVTLGECHWVQTNRVMKRNRRIGTSLSGIAQFLAKHSLNTLKEWLIEGYEIIQRYDVVYSDWFAIPRSIKTTSIKPSGCISESTFVRVYETADSTDYISMRMGDVFADIGVDYASMKAGSWIDLSNQLIVDAGGKKVVVKRLFVNGSADCVEVPTEKGSIVCTPDHKFWVMPANQTTPCWIKAVDLQPDDDILPAVE